MYAMTLQHTAHAGAFVPTITLTLERPLLSDAGLDISVADLFIRLQALGWGRARDERARAAADPLVDVHIGPAGVWLYAADLPDLNGGVIMADGGPPPRPPEHWWSWVDRFDKQCAVTLIADPVDLSAPDVLAAFNQAAQRGAVLMALGRVISDRPGDFTYGLTPD